MMALSVRQPWAWAIIYARKDIENRNWPTRFRGRFLVHASKGMTRDEYEDCLDTMCAISRAAPFPKGLTLPTFDELERGGIVGSVDLVDCVSDHSSPWFFGTYGFVLRNPEPLPFRPVRGALGFFSPDAVPGPQRAKPQPQQPVKPKPQMNLFDES
ncbi:MAG: ASCH domain-containing protein [Pseudomonadota bacterium]|nr:ASCH domain-containing protein [Pseudomonadota bacterium]